MQETNAINRRTFVSYTAATAGVLALAGCADTDGTDTDDTDTDDTAEDDLETMPEFLEVEDPPDAVYVPTHREAMRMLEPVEAGDMMVAPMLSYPHPFWIVAGTGADSLERTDPEDDRGVHMMFTVWDRETGVVLPVDDGAQIQVERDGESVGSPVSPWTMISQEMGFHFGDNVSLPEDGTYTVEVTLPPLSTRTTGDLEGRLEESATATFEFTYDDEFRHEVVGGVEYFDEDIWGERGALEPMDHGEHGHGDDGHDHGDHDDHGDHEEGHNHDHEDHDDHADHDGHDDEHDHDDGHDHGDHDEHDHHAVPYSALPEIDAYPGTILVDPEEGDVPDVTEDLPESGDARFLATVLESDHRLAEAEAYLLVSPRTPYNRVPLADMSMTATVERDGEVLEESALEQTIDGTYDLHYGASVPELEAGDTVTIETETPPQVARHQGYETAFLEMPLLELQVPEQ